MIVTNKTEKKLASCFAGRKTISTPELQLEMELGYCEARSLIEFAIKRGWIKSDPVGIDYALTGAGFEKREVPEDLCLKIAERLRYSHLKLLKTFGNKYSMTFDDICRKTGSDPDKTSDLIDTLAAFGIMFEHESVCYCNMSEKSLAFLQKPNEEIVRFRPSIFEDFFGSSGGDE